MKRLLVIVFVCSTLAAWSQDSDSVPVKKGYGVPVEQTQPEFPGGRDSLRVFLRHHVHYPREALQNNVRGKVWLSFTVDTAGVLRDKIVLKSVSPEVDNEALRVLDLMPPWQPALRAGKPVDTPYILQIEFVPPGQK